jgi:UDP-N-acetylglucosamine acyltransferase
MGIHPTAVIDESAVLGDNVTVGPFAVIGPGVKVGDGTEIRAHAVVERDTALGRGCRVYPFACLGSDPQDITYKGEKTTLEIGDNVVVRESATIHRGSVHGGGVTRIGNSCYIMASSHTGHDCQLDDEVILTSFAVLAGHVALGACSVVSGLSAVHQFVRIGAYAFIGGMSGIAKDVPPYMLTAGVRGRMLITPNLVGLKRRGFTPEQIKTVSEVRRLLNSKRPIEEVLNEIDLKYGGLEEARNITDFYRSSERGVYR